MKKRLKQSRKYIIIALFVLVLSLGVAYAMFSDTLTIAGTANANGNFDMEFVSCTTVNPKGVNTTDTKGVISSDKNTLTVTVADLAYPGAGAQFDVVIKNAGNIPAKVSSVTPKVGGVNVSAITGNEAIEIVGLDAITASHPTIEPNGTCELSFYVKWKSNISEISNENKNLSFNLDIEYIQDTEEFTGVVNHVDVNP